MAKFRRNAAVAKAKVDKVQNKKIAKIQKQLKVGDRLVNITITGGVLVAAGSISFVSGIAQGDDVSNRQGNIVKPVELIVKLKTTNITSAPGRTIRYILFQDTLCVGSPATVGDVLDAATTQAAKQEVNHLNKRHHILFDYTRSLDISRPIELQTFHIKGSRMKPLKYNLTTDVVAAAGANAMFLLAIVDNVTTATTLDASFQLRFED